MNAEHMHQLYGGEISDYSSPKLLQRQFEDPQQTNSNLAEIYDQQIKGKPSINTAGIVSANFNIPKIRDPHFDKLDNQLRNTLNSIAKEINLQPSDMNQKPISIGLRDQTQTDIEAANNNVLQAIKELEGLKAI